ncbi:ALG2 [Symbiodinium sp. KB8]|nr:ALG2 [Symbiodinium sp. KB8]
MPLRIAMLHPDLGIGGAERLVVDAAMALVEKGHTVDMYTSHYSPERAFQETRSGAFPIHVYGDWLPREIAGTLHIVFALLRNLWLTCAVLLSGKTFDIFICDQVSICVPVLRMLAPHAKVLFYCHFPDQLLSSRGGWLKALYRAPFDALEEVTTAAADGILVNSNFTKGVVQNTFKSLAGRMAEVRVLYPCIDVGSDSTDPAPPHPQPVMFLSINRYERKKNINLAIQALAELDSTNPPSPVCLLVAGGYDPRVAENTEHYEELHSLAKGLGLRTLPEAASDTMANEEVIAGVLGGGARGPQVGFLRSFTDEEKQQLLQATSGVVYTPTNEHFGIVPIETMAAHRPVLACASGGPLESIRHETTAFLLQPEPGAFAGAMRQLADEPGRVTQMGAAGRARAEAVFSRQAFAMRLSNICEHLFAHGSLAGLTEAS